MSDSDSPLTTLAGVAELVRLRLRRLLTWYRQDIESVIRETCGSQQDDLANKIIMAIHQRPLPEM